MFTWDGILISSVIMQGPYIARKNPTESDYALIPKLHHMRVALAHYMDFKILAKFTALHKYIEVC
jgi:hypothetical protein